MAKGKGKYEIHPMKAAEKRRESLGQGKFELDDMVEYSLGGKTLDTQFVLRRMLNRTRLHR